MAARSSGTYLYAPDVCEAAFVSPQMECQKRTNDMFDSSCSVNRSASVTAQRRAPVTQLIIRRRACLR